MKPSELRNHSMFFNFVITVDIWRKITILDTLQKFNEHTMTMRKALEYLQ